MITYIEYKLYMTLISFAQFNLLHHISDNRSVKNYVSALCITNPGSNPPDPN